MRSTVQLIAALALLVTSLLLPRATYAQSGATNCQYPSVHERFGVTAGTNIGSFNVAPLSAGGYLNWDVNQFPQHPAAMTYYPMVHITSSGLYPSASELEKAVRRNIGSTWIIGNEAETIWMDNVTPERYAEGYHEVYTIIKSIDPNAKLVATSLATVSTLRLAWLDRAWNHYRTRYGVDMPVDAWNVHTYVVNEMHNEWGAEIPQGIDNAVGYGYGTWAQANDAGASGGTVHQSRNTGARAYFAFHGNRVTLALRTGPDAGIAELYIDEPATPVATVDLYAPAPGTVTRTFTNLAPPGGLRTDRHNIRAVVTGRKNPASTNTWVRVDYATAPSTSSLPAGRLEDNNAMRAKIITSVNDHDNLDQIEQMVRSFRQWMLNHGQRNKPLINTEYGILMTEDLGFTYSRVRTFMINSFNRFLNNFQDPALGMPDDNNRLLQQWFWFALAQDSFEGRTSHTGLFSEATYQIKPLGQEFANYVTPLKQNYVDLEVYSLSARPYWPLFAGNPTLVKVDATVRNRGNQASGAFQVAARSGGSAFHTWNVAGLPKRFDAGYMTTLSTDWTTTITAPTIVRAVADEADQVPEPCSDNNSYRVTITPVQGTDMALSNVRSVPALVPVVPPGSTTTLQLAVDLENLGSIGTSAGQITVKFWNGNPNAGGALLATKTLTPGNVSLPAVVSHDWPNVGPGVYDAYVQVERVPEETNLANNQANARIMVPSSRLYLPVAPQRRMFGRVTAQAQETVPEATLEMGLPFQDAALEPASDLSLPLQDVAPEPAPGATLQLTETLELSE